MDDRRAGDEGRVFVTRAARGRDRVNGLKLPSLSNSLYVARLRHIQSIHEPTSCRNPDTFVRRLLPLRERLRARWIGADALRALRSDPFYHFLIARTRHYDDVVTAAVA